MIQPIQLMGDAPLTGWAQVGRTIHHRQALRMISPSFNNAERSAEQGWRIYDAACDGNPEPVDGQMLAELLQMAVILDTFCTLTHAMANIEYSEVMALDLVQECHDNGVNQCLCATCHPERPDMDEPIPFGGGA